MSALLVAVLGTLTAAGATVTDVRRFQIIGCTSACTVSWPDGTTTRHTSHVDDDSLAVELLRLLLEQIDRPR